MNNHTFWQGAYAVGALCSIGLICVSIVGLFVEDDVLYNLYGLAFGVGLSVANVKWFRDERRVAAAKQSGGAA